MSLKEHRKSLADYLEGQMTHKVYAFLPENLPTPAVAFMSGQPYITPPPEGDGRFCAGENFVNIVAVCLIAAGGNDRIIDEMDDLVEELVSAVPGSGWSIDQVGSYYSFSISGNNAQVLACDVNLTTLVQF